MLDLIPGGKYYRADVKEMAGLERNAKGGPWDTGVVEHDGEFLIFSNVGTEGRTGHDYDNRWEGGHLRWYHKRGSHKEWPSVRKLLEVERIVHLFWRTSNAAPFEYAGNAKAIEVFDTSPVEVLWAIVTSSSNAEFFQGPDEIPSSKEYREGAIRQVPVNVYERDPAARQACIDHYGPACFVCGLRFEDRYGTIGVGYIHVHHLTPLSEIGVDYEINPIEDLRPVCPNCHAMIHRRRPPFSAEDIRKMLRC